MNKTILFALIFSSIGLKAQQYYPILFKTPVTGFDKLKQDNPYVLSLLPDAGGWKPSIREQNVKAPNIGYTGFQLYSAWVDDAWLDRENTTDSFVLDNQNRLAEVYNKSIYDFPGFSQKTKSKFLYFYNALNQLERFEAYDAVNFTSTVYRKSETSYYTYDAEGKRTRDSSIYYSPSGNQLLVSTNSYTGDKLSRIIQVTGVSDTVRKFDFMYDGDLLTVASVQGLNDETNEFELTHSDTFEYNALNQITRRISFGYVYRDGVLSLEPTGNDSYTYRADNQLEEEVIRLWDNGAWMPFSKRTFTYGANNKPEVGYEYVSNGSGWSSIPRTQYLFSIQTGLKAEGNPLSKVTLLPNPANDILTINLNTHKANLKVFDISGKCVYEIPETSGTQQLDVSGFKSGLYYVVANDGEHQYTQKIQVAH